MNISSLIGLLNNAAILLAFAVLYENFWLKSKKQSRIINQIFNGVLLGLITILIMKTPWVLSEGLVFDTRSVILAIIGYFFGLIPAIISALFAVFLRLNIGGDGTTMGIAVIISATIIGLLWTRRKPKLIKNNAFIEFLVLGFVVHFVMMACILLTPKEIRQEVFFNMLIPLLTLYPLTTMLLGALLYKQKANYENMLAKEKLMETENKLSKILKSGNIISIILDNNANLIYCNDYFLNLTNYKKNEIINKNWFDIFIINKEFNSTFKLFKNASDSKQKNIDNINRIKTKNDNELIISWTNTPIYNIDNELQNIISIGVDITETKNFEQKLIENNKQLKAAEERAVRSNQLKDEFIKNMSHEIRTPMNGIYGFVSLLEDEKLNNEKRKKFFHIIKKNTLQLNRVIEDIMEISKLSTKQIRVQNKTVNIKEMLNDLHSVFKLKIDNSNIDFILETPDDNEEINLISDESKLIKIISNLIENSIKFTKEGFIKIAYIKVNGQVQIYIEDSGIGIPKEKHESIFNRFSRSQFEGDINHSGLGLGLSIVKENAELLNAKVQLESEENKGSKFIISLPLKK